ncbi:hypothetical protein E3N88_01468 [Mikania micrantha]|uniref:Uncharacterized protein n=1 Tax=Mikania micrantha TaxID=192012 RepID=A0A5N6Q1A3_9ASTR|nr:hypothetical protein E3N88_01468 [Mikania micrantha]
MATLSSSVIIAAVPHPSNTNLLCDLEKKKGLPPRFMLMFIPKTSRRLSAAAQSAPIPKGNGIVTLFPHVSMHPFLECFATIKELQSFRSSNASEESSYALKTKTSEVYPSSKTVAEHVQSTKGTDTRHAGLSKDKDNM